MGNSPSIFHTTPHELCQQSQRAMKELKSLRRRGYVPPPLPPGYIQVQFYADIQGLYRGTGPDIQSEVLLDQRTGELDVEAIKRAWGLETCVPIDPTRWTIFRPNNEKRLSPLAVEVLSDNQRIIKFTEPYTSRPTQIKRTIRRYLIAFTLFLLELYSHISRLLLRSLETQTPHIPRIYRSLKERKQTLTWKMERWVDEKDLLSEPRARQLGTLIGAVIWILMVGLVVSWVVGWRWKSKMPYAEVDDGDVTKQVIWSWTGSAVLGS
ncbi:hypothetical protein BDN72DRAFT_895920 [Pluteus cervinus]|uniref:Uncharacterized protein n=1 Tax=Pluteus cervinus TaxID=181527 RepID=A0ACD3AZF0_9AGAR|nr:hypothetical protein BDN72DRAFT_895920 [Pluteus cervinus]